MQPGHASQWLQKTEDQTLRRELALLEDPGFDMRNVLFGREPLEQPNLALMLKEGLLEDALARQRRAEQDAATARVQLKEELEAASAARERSKSAAAEGLAEREEKAALRAQAAAAQAQLASLRASAKASPSSLLSQKYPLSHSAFVRP
jgi:hypothetical protein